jgi:protein-S-isoprenylcysteine O-methyltransferase Ste14
LILVLFLLNVNSWFIHPFAWYQLLSWILLFGSIIPLVLGVLHLKKYGQPAAEREGSTELLAFERTSQLVTSGIYHFIRHPLYSSLLLLTWGIFFKLPNGWGVLLAVVVTFLLIATARADEEECLAYFGSAYREYMHLTKWFIPYLF